MPRRFNCMLQTDSGLVEGTVVWMDKLHLHVLCPERLPSKRGVRARVDLGPLGDSVDLQLTVVELAAGRTAQIGRGWLHRTRWIGVTLEQGDRVSGLMKRINPQLALESAISSAHSRSSAVSSIVSDYEHVRSRSRSRSRSESRSRSQPGGARRDGSVSTPSWAKRRDRSGSASESASGHRSRRGTMPAILAPGRPVNVLVEAGDAKALGRALRLGPSSVRLAVRFEREHETATDLLLVFRLPDGSFVQLPAKVLRMAGRRWLVEANDVAEPELAVLRRLAPKKKR